MMLKFLMMIWENIEIEEDVMSPFKDVRKVSHAYENPFELLQTDHDLLERRHCVSDRNRANIR